MLRSLLEGWESRRVSGVRSRARVALALRPAAALARPARLHVSLASLASIFTLLAGACATGGETDPGVDDDEDSGLRIDAGRLPEPAKGDGGPLIPKPTDAGVVDAGAVPDASDACAAALSSLAFGFESGAQGWVHDASDSAAGQTSWPYDGWAQGVATKGAGCRSGSCFGVELTQNYAQCQRGYLLSPPLDLRACVGRNVALVFQHAYAFWSSSPSFDGGVLEVSSDGATWQVPPATGVYSGTLSIRASFAGYSCKPAAFGASGKQGFVGKKPTTEKVSVLLPASAISATTRVRFSMASGVSSQTFSADTSRSGTDFGWRIDDVGFELR